MVEQYRVIIVGAGPAGIFAALELTRAGVGGVLLLERGPDLPERQRLGRGGSMLSGWGGAGAYSDGKLALSTEIGGFMNRYCTPGQMIELVEYVMRPIGRSGRRPRSTAGMWRPSRTCSAGRPL